MRKKFALLLGVVAIAVARKAVANSRNAHIGALRGADATKAISIVGVMTAHSFSEGVGVGVSYGGGATLGVVITLAGGLCALVLFVFWIMGLVSACQGTEKRVPLLGGIELYR